MDTEQKLKSMSGKRLNTIGMSLSLKRAGQWLLPVWLLAVPVAAHSEQVTLAMENAEVIDLINWASDYLDKTIIIHPGVQGRVSVISGQPISRDEAYQVFLSVLQVHGFAVVEEENALKVVPLDVAKQTGAPLIMEQAEVSIEDLVVRIIRLDHADAAQLIPLLQPFVSQFGHMADYARTNSLIIADRADNIAEMVKIIREFDLGRMYEVDMIPLEFANVADVLDVVIDHGAKPDIANGLFQPWADAIETIAANTGANCKLSGLLTEAGDEPVYEKVQPYMQHLLDCFGAERLMWGSDWPVLELVSDYHSWNDMVKLFLHGLGEIDRLRIMGGNAKNFYGL